MSSERAGLEPRDWLRYAAIALILVEGGIHLQQFEGPLNMVPTINALFVANAVTAGAIALVLAASRGTGSIAAALAGIGFTIGSLISLAISRTGTLFDFSEPTLRAAITLATVVELAAVVALSAYAVATLRASPSAPAAAR